ncbi:MAG: hypothetical protein E6G75_15990 [Alphaproteobacteria bacterium]|nr:MAG: hypothetical protein E6G75_15990 [Alphaproteobacteria bacterium]
MILYEMLIAIGIAVVLVVAAIDRSQQKRDARAAAAAAQRRLVAAAAQRRLVAYWTRFLKLQYEPALAAPLPARLATLITQLETRT